MSEEEFEEFDEDFSLEEGQDSSQDLSAGEGEGVSPSQVMSNPKIKLIFIGAVLLIGTLAFLMFSGEEDKEAKVVMKAGNTAGVAYIPGQEKLDPAYKKALEENNRQMAEQASKTGASALPAPTEVNKVDEDKSTADLTGGGEKDPLEEWKLSSERRKLNEGEGGNGIGDDAENAGNKNCTPTLDQCRDLMKDAGLLEEMCRDALKDSGLLEKMCKDLLRDTNVLDDMCRDKMTKDGMLGAMHVDQCKKLLRDMGILGADGQIVDGVNGSTAKKECPEGYLCDASGNVMLDANGNPIKLGDTAEKKVCPEGYLCDPQGNVMLDANGNPIRLDSAGKKVCPEGYLCDPQGNVMLDANGNPIRLDGAGAGANELSAYGANGAYGSDTTSGGMASFVDPRKATNGGQSNPEEVKRLVDQMRSILSTIAPETFKQQIITTKDSPYEEMRQEQEAAAAAALSKKGKTGAVTTTSSSTVSSAASSEASSETEITDEQKALEKVIAVPGEIFYAQTVTEVNSDVESTVLATVLTGPFTGGRLIGSFELQGEALTLTFKTVVKNDVSYKIDGVALDQKTSLPGLATDVESHYMERIILPAAAKFIEGYSAAIAETATTTEESSSGDTDTTEEAEPSPKESLYAGMEEAASTVADIVDDAADKPITVKIKRGTTFGLLMLKKVTVGDAM